MSYPSKMRGAILSGATSLLDRISGPVLDWENEGYDQSRSGGQHAARRTELGPTEEEILDRDLQRESHKLAKLDSAIAHLEHKIQSTKAELPNSESRNQETKNEIETVNQDLMATRAHAPDEGTMQNVDS